MSKKQIYWLCLVLGIITKDINVSDERVVGYQVVAILAFGLFYLALAWSMGALNE